MKASSMKTSLDVDSLLADPQPLSTAANEEFAAAAQATGGWDPYEVWRTRVRAVQNKPKVDSQDR
jgi:hypothetical protein